MRLKKYASREPGDWSTRICHAMNVSRISRLVVCSVVGWTYHTERPGMAEEYKSRKNVKEMIVLQSINLFRDLSLKLILRKTV